MWHLLKEDGDVLLKEDTDRLLIDYLITDRPIRAKARILPPSAFQTSTEAGVRQIGAKLEIKWDGNSWIDESTYLISVKGNTKLSGRYGEGVVAEIDVELDNTTDRFDPGNISSPIYGYIKPKIQVRVSITIGTSGYYTKLFTGYTKTYTPNSRTKVCSIHCFDGAQDLIGKSVRRSLYTNYRIDQLVEQIITDPDVGMVAGEYNLEVSDFTVHGAWFKDKTAWSLLGELCIAERGRVFFDGEGTLRFWNRQHLRNLPALAAATLTRNEWIKNINYTISEQTIKNRIIVKAKPRAEAGTQVVWSNGDAEVLDPYADTLVGIPALESQQAFLELEDPCVDWIQPLPNVDYIANTESDGSGTDVTDHVHISEWTPYDDAVWLSVRNDYDGLVYLTTFQIRANPVRVWKWVKSDYSDEVSIGYYGELKIELESDFIDSEELANGIATEELGRWKEAKSNFKIDMLGIPYMLCGDIISVETQPASYENYMIETLDWTLDNKGFNQKISLVEPISIPTTRTITARARIA